MDFSPSNDPPALQRETLPCGLELLFVPRPGARVATADIWVGTGSADEPPTLNGVSHFLEHMLFKGAGPYGVGEIDRLIEGVGGLVNAGTSHDFTHYHVTVASLHFETALRLLGEMIRGARLDAGELDRERQVILEEYLIKQDQPQGLLWEELYLRAFQAGPYRAPILGTPETLQAIDADEMRGYYERLYCPANMVLIVVGDLPPERTIESARRVFDGFDRPCRPLLDRGALRTAYAPAGEYIIEKDISETYGAIAFPAPALGDFREVWGLDVLQVLLGGGNASILHQEIKEKRRLATSIGVSFSSSRHPDLFCIYYTCEEARRAELDRAIVEQLDAAAQSPPAPAALERARRLLANEHLFSLETTSGESSSLGYFRTVTGGVDFERQYVPGVLSVTALEVQRLAQRWLTTDQTTRVLVRPRGEAS